MFKENSFVTTIGTFVVKSVGDEYIELDPYGKGTLEMQEQYEENGFKEVTADGNVKEHDGFEVGDFFKLNGKYKVVRSNELFTKVSIGLGQKIVSLPNHKLMEVE